MLTPPLGRCTPVRDFGRGRVMLVRGRHRNERRRRIRCESGRADSAQGSVSMLERSSSSSRPGVIPRQGARVSRLLLGALGLVACGNAGGTTPSAPLASGSGGSYGSGYITPPGGGGSNSNPGGASNGGAPSTTGGAANDGGNSVGQSGAGGGPSGVSFDWPETIPGQGKPCKAGHYVGTFQCLYQPAGTPDGSAGGLLITGPIDFKLQQAQTGEFLEVSGGTLDGLALIAIHFKADISGKLSCGTGAFAGNLVNGSYAIDPFPAGGTFNGPMDGFSSNTPPCTGTCLGGTWALHETGAAGTGHIGTCAGTWTATLQP